MKTSSAHCTVQKETSAIEADMAMINKLQGFSEPTPGRTSSTAENEAISGPMNREDG